MKRAGAILFPLLILAWFVMVINPDLIPGAGYASSYLLPLIAIMVIVRAVSTAKKKQVNNDRPGPLVEPSKPNIAPSSPNPNSPAAPSTPASSSMPSSPASSLPPSSAAPAEPPAAASEAPPPPVQTPPSPGSAAAPAAEAPTGVDALPADLVAQLRELRTGGRTIEAVELLRDRTGMELYEASQLVIGLNADS